MSLIGRMLWATYFSNEGVQCLFYSAKKAQEAYDEQVRLEREEELMAEVFPEFHRQSSLLAGQHPKL